MTLPDVVGNRNNFVAIEDYADLLIRSPRSGFTETDRPVIMALFKRMVSDISQALATGAERGIGQATELILDEEFYEAKRRRRERSSKAAAERAAAEEANKQRRRNNPTVAEIAESMRHLNENIAYHEKALETCRGQIQWLQSRPAYMMNSDSGRPNA